MQERFKETAAKWFNIKSDTISKSKSSAPPIPAHTDDQQDKESDDSDDD